jgi:hypothetical protein
MKNFSDFTSLDNEIKVSLQILQILNCEIFSVIWWLAKPLLVATVHGHEIEIRSALLNKLSRKMQRFSIVSSCLM